MTRAAGCALAAGTLLASVPIAAIAGNTIAEQIQVREEVHRHLVRMGHVTPGPSYEQEMDRKVDELGRAVGSFPDLALESLSHFLRNPEDDFTECTVVFALGRFPGGDPARVARILIRALPAKNAAADRCVGDALAALGPDAYPPVVECAEEKGLEKSVPCLQALLAQSAHLPAAAQALGIGGAGEADVSPDRREEVRDAAARWWAWWESNRARLRWDPASRRLEESD